MSDANQLHAKKNDDLAVCETDHDGRVISQNDRCLNACGDNRGTVCKIGCNPLLERATQLGGQPALERPMIFRSRELNDRFYDIVYTPTTSGSIRLLSPLGEKYSVKLESLRSCGLTAQEFKIAALMLKGLGNGEIGEKLNITRSTVKAHINRIYRKLGGQSHLVGRI